MPLRFDRLHAAIDRITGLELLAACEPERAERLLRHARHLRQLVGRFLPRWAPVAARGPYGIRIPGVAPPPVEVPDLAGGLAAAVAAYRAGLDRNHGGVGIALVNAKAPGSAVRPVARIITRQA